MWDIVGDLMSKFTERFEDSDMLKALGELEAAIAADDTSPLSEDVSDDHGRLLHAMAHLRASVDNADPELVTPRMLETLRKSILDLKVQYDMFVKNREMGGVNEATDAMLNHVQTLPRKWANRHAESGAYIEAVRTQAQVAIQSASEKSKAVESASGALSTKLEAIEKDIGRQSSKLEAQEKRLDSFLSEQQADHLKELKERNDAYEAAKLDRETRFSEQMDEWDEQVATMAKERAVSMDQRITEFSKNGTTALEELQAHLNKAEKIVGLIANTGMAAHYQKVADRETRDGRIMKVIAFLFFAGMAGTVIWVTTTIRAEDFRWEVGIFRVLGALTLLAGAAYAARESTGHQAAARRARRTELELAAIQSFLAPLPEEKQQEVIERLSDRYFGREDTATAATERDESVQSLVNAVTRIIEACAKLR